MEEGEHGHEQPLVEHTGYVHVFSFLKGDYGAAHREHVMTVFIFAPLLLILSRYKSAGGVCAGQGQKFSIFRIKIFIKLKLKIDNQSFK